MALLIANITSRTLLELNLRPKRERLLFSGLFISRNFHTKENWTYYKSYEELAEAFGMKVSNIRNAAIALQADGWLSKPEIKIFDDPELAGRKIKKYRWRFPKHEAEFKHAKERIQEIEAANAAKRHDIEIDKARVENDEILSEITPEGLKALAQIFKVARKG